MAIVTNLPIAVQAANAAALRAQASAGLTANTVATSVEGGRIALYSWVPASLAVDSGASPEVRKPNDILPANPGRWLVRDWPDETGVSPPHGELLVPVDVNPTGPAALLISEGWTVVAVTHSGAVRTAWLRRLVQVG